MSWFRGICVLGAVGCVAMWASPPKLEIYEIRSQNTSQSQLVVRRSDEKVFNVQGKKKAIYRRRSAGWERSPFRLTPFLGTELGRVKSKPFVGIFGELNLSRVVSVEADLSALYDGFEDVFQTSGLIKFYLLSGAWQPYLAGGILGRYESTIQGWSPAARGDVGLQWQVLNWLALGARASGARSFSTSGDFLPWRVMATLGFIL